MRVGERTGKGITIALHSLDVWTANDDGHVVFFDDSPEQIQPSGMKPCACGPCRGKGLNKCQGHVMAAVRFGS